MKTELVYLNDTYLLEDEAKLLSIDNDERGTFAIFDRTIFYPQGGGQESDTGIVKIEFDGRELTFEIKKVRFQDGQVLHYGNFVSQQNLTGCSVKMLVDQKTRMRNAKLHSAGHLIASIVEEMNIGLRATKGFHFKTGPYIGFMILNQTSLDPKEILTRLNEQIFSDIKKGSDIRSEIVSFDSLKKLCNYLPSYLPQDKPLRIVTISGYPPIPCGGTHVGSLMELVRAKAIKTKIRKGEFRISYEVSE